MGDYGRATRRVMSRPARHCHSRVSTGVKKPAVIACSVFVRQCAVG